MTDDPCLMSATKLATAVRRGDRSPVEIVEAHLARIRKRDDDLHAYITVLDEEARERAREIERALNAGGSVGPLCGVPVAVKDLFAFKTGTPHTFGSPLCAKFVPDDDSVVVKRLEAAGAVVLGKTSTPEFGHKATTDNELIGATGTPLAPERTAGGTSGGSAAAVAAGMASLAQGSDAGGSIRIPAACCGVYGLKPSFGRVPYDGRPNAFAAHTPFVQQGPLARTVADAALFLDVVTGKHPDDPFSLPSDRSDYRSALQQSVADLEVAYSPNLGLFVVEEEVQTVVDDAITDLEAAGATIEQVTPEYPHNSETIREAWRTFFQMLALDVAGTADYYCGTNLLREDRDAIDPLYGALLDAAQSLTVTDYKRADVVRTGVYDAVEAVLAEYDLLVAPTMGVPPFDKHEIGPDEIAGKEVDPYIDWMLTWPFNMSGHPAASIPAGVTDDGLPVGVQIVGRRFDDKTVLAVSATLERERPWHDIYTTL